LHDLSQRQLTTPSAGTAAGLRSAEAENLILAFDDNRLLSLIFGEHDEHLALIEDRLGVDITPRGNRLSLRGTLPARDNARQVLTALYDRARAGLDVTPGDVEGAIRMSSLGGGSGADGEFHLRTWRKVITPRSPGQRAYMQAIRDNELVFGTGPAGTGKTYLAVACAAAELASGKVDRIVLSRPAVEAGERLGFLPGDMKEKVDPYLRPLYDALYDVMPANMVQRGMADGTIEIAPLAFMRGRTLKSAFVILDEAQNTTPQQMKMFLTRLGEGSRMVVNGDPTQVDLPNGAVSGLEEAVKLLESVKGIFHVVFTRADIVRHPLVTRIVEAYEQAAKKPSGRKG
jgi:phosphate starvation-inducible protein PhoH and related proteins